MNIKKSEEKNKGFIIKCRECREEMDIINREGKIYLSVYNFYDSHEIEVSCTNCGNVVRDFE